MKQVLSIGIAVYISCAALQAAIIRVPQDHATIQRGLNAAGNGDTVLVADGTYTGNENKNLDFAGKSITLRSGNGPYLCVIDCEYSGSGIVFDDSENRYASVTGFTVQHGHAANGGGIYCADGSSPTITNCRFLINQASTGDGGAIACLDSCSPAIVNCVFESNTSADDGGAIICNGGSNPLIGNCLFETNDAGDDGGAICCMTSSAPEIVNCTFQGNSAASHGDVLFAEELSVPTFSNCILWDNPTEPVYGSPVIAFSDVQGGWTGTGNIDSDPLFVSGADGDHYLSQIDSGQGTDSSCVNSGDRAASELCFDAPAGLYCMSMLHTRTDSAGDSGLVDMGYHYPVDLEPAPRDPQPQEVDDCTVLLLHMDEDGNPAFSDGSPSNHPVTLHGDPTLDPGDFHFGTAAGLFDGDGDYLSVPDDADWNFTDDELTIDFWVNIEMLPMINNGMGIIGQYENLNRFWSLMLFRTSEGGDRLRWTFSQHQDAGWVFDIVAYTDIVENTWYHIAVVRDDEFNYRIFQNGELLASEIDTDPSGAVSGELTIARCWMSQDYYLTGFLDELRINKGIARWTDNFTPPSRPYEPITKLLLHCDDSGFSNSSLFIHPVTVNGPSSMDPGTYPNENPAFVQAGYFDGSNDYLTVDDDVDFTLAGDFTFDCFFRTVDLSESDQTIIGKGYYDPLQTSNFTFRIDPANDGRVEFFSYNGQGDEFALTSPYSFVADQWYHLALVRLGTTVSLYLDGNRLNSGVSSRNFGGNTADLSIGYDGLPGLGQYFTGWIDEIRITNGYARWTTDFTPPECPFELENCQPVCVTPTPTPTPTFTPTNTPTAAPPTATPTITPTRTPTFTNTPTRTPTFTSTSTPTHTHTPTITPTQQPPTITPPNTCDTLGVKIWMPSTFYQAGDYCELAVFVCNTTGVLVNDWLLWVILDVNGHLFFAPDFNEFGYYHLAYEPGLTRVQIIPGFFWPDCTSTGNANWYSALTDMDITHIVGEWDTFAFGWSAECTPTPTQTPTPPKTISCTFDGIEHDFGQVPVGGESQDAILGNLRVEGPGTVTINIRKEEWPGHSEFFPDDFVYCQGTSEEMQLDSSMGDVPVCVRFHPQGNQPHTSQIRIVVSADDWDCAAYVSGIGVP